MPILMALAAAASAAAAGLPQSTPEAAGLLSPVLESIDGAVRAAIASGETPGAVVLVARKGRIAYLKAFGNRSLQPGVEPMTTDTIFDLSSLTKVVATVPSVMLLLEGGSLRLEDRVKRYLPGFAGGGKDPITVRDLLTHYSGLPQDLDLSRSWTGRAGALEEIARIPTQTEPGKEFAYSDLNFIVLGELVAELSGEALDVFAHKRIFTPLGMSDTCFRPPQALLGRIAPTEPRKSTLQYLKGAASGASMDPMLRGEVHDPTAWRMGGVAGHAGLFSTARDLAVYAQMLLDRGASEGARVLSPMAVDAMTSPQSPPQAPQVRGYGWDIDSIYSSPRGDIFRGGFGHTGFAGTSIWVHPPTASFVIVLTNRVHPDGGKDINHLRGVIANIVASAIF